MVEQYEEVIEDWYKGNQEEDLTMYLCDKHVLKGQDKGNTHFLSFGFLSPSFVFVTLLLFCFFSFSFYYLPLCHPQFDLFFCVQPVWVRTGLHRNIRRETRPPSPRTRRRRKRRREGRRREETAARRERSRPRRRRRRRWRRRKRAKLRWRRRTEACRRTRRSSHRCLFLGRRRSCEPWFWFLVPGSGSWFWFWSGPPEQK